MSPNQPFQLIYDPQVIQHLRAIDRKYYSLIRRTIEEQLSYEPMLETQNRKPLQRSSPFGTAWELRFGPNNRFRVFYRIETEEGEEQVYILAIAVKVGSLLMAGGEEFPL